MPDDPPDTKPPRWSSGTLDTRRATACGRLLGIWDKAPNLRLGELIEAALQADGRLDVAQTLTWIENDDLFDALERYVLMVKPR